MTTTPVRAAADLSAQELAPTGRVIWNPTTPMLYEDAVKRGDGRIAEGGPLTVDTGVHTGRSPKDKFVVKEPDSEGRIWWGTVNQPLEPQKFDGLRAKVVAYLESQPVLYVVDAFAGADPGHRIGVRVVTASAVPRAVREDDVHRAHRRRCRRRTRRRPSCSTLPWSRPTRQPTARAPGRSSRCIPRGRRC